MEVFFFTIAGVLWGGPQTSHFWKGQDSEGISKWTYTPCKDVFYSIVVEGRFWKLPISYHFSKEEVERLITKTKVVPAVNQLEFHPWVPWIRTFFVSFFCQGLGWRIHAKMRFFVQNENSSHRCVFFETVWYSLCISRNNLVTFKKWFLNKSQWQWMNLIDWIYLLYISIEIVLFSLLRCQQKPET